MIGAILGDIVGSPYEFDQGEKIKDFGPLFIEESNFTDDSVMTVAVAEGLMNAGIDSDIDTIKSEVVKSMKSWGKKYPYAGYGYRFGMWLNSRDTEPYGSWGNGSAMRVSSVGWLYDSLERTREVARATAEITHNHLEGIKGAEVTASAIYLARTGSSKDEIEQYIKDEFSYDLSRTLDEIRPSYHHVESCQETVPEALTAFFEGNDFEDVVRNAVSLGGDCDTLTCIAAGIAEAFYGIPEELEKECRSHISEDLLRIVDGFYSLTKGILFRYELCDAWFNPQNSITVYSDGKVDCFHDSENAKGVGKKPLTVNKSIIDEIKDILSDINLYRGQAELLSPSEIGVNILDGYRQSFSISDGIHLSRYNGSNIQFFENEHKRCPLEALLIDTLFSVGELLINEGVDEKCFRIDPDEEWSIPLADRKYGTEDKQRIVSDLIAYLESREDGYSITTALLIKNRGFDLDSFGTMDLFDINDLLFKEARKRHITLDNSAHSGKQEGLPFALDFVLRKK